MWKRCLTPWDHRHKRSTWQLCQRPVKTVVHLRRLLHLVRLYGRQEVLAAIAQALEYQTYDAAYVETLLLQERRRRELPSPTPLRPERQELIEEIELDEPDPGDYDRFCDETMRRQNRMSDRHQQLHKLLQQDLAELKLRKIAEIYREVLDEAARKNTSMLEVLASLIASEVTFRRQCASGASDPSGQAAQAQDAGRLRLHLPQTDPQTEDPPPVRLRVRRAAAVRRADWAEPELEKAIS